MSDKQFTAQGVADGWKLVPIEPTQEILSGICHAKNQTAYGVHAVMSQSDLASIYKAMLAAAPAPAALPDGDYQVEYKCQDCGHKQTITELVRDGRTYTGGSANWCEKCGDGLLVRIGTAQAPAPPEQPQEQAEAAEMHSALRALSMAMGNPAVIAEGPQTIESQLVRLAAERFTAQKEQAEADRRDAEQIPDGFTTCCFSGGQGPELPVDAMVEVMFRNGETAVGRVGSWYWDRCPSEVNEIVAYRLADTALAAQKEV